MASNPGNFHTSSGVHFLPLGCLGGVRFEPVLLPPELPDALPELEDADRELWEPCEVSEL